VPPFRRSRPKSVSPPIPGPISEARSAAVRAFRQIETRAISARSTEIVQAVNQVYDLYSGGPVETCRDSLRAGFASASVKANDEELDALAHAITAGEFKPIRVEFVTRERPTTSKRSNSR
jgi:hypothetical protein